MPKTIEVWKLAIVMSVWVAGSLILHVLSLNNNHELQQSFDRHMTGVVDTVAYDTLLAWHTSPVQLVTPRKLFLFNLRAKSTIDSIFYGHLILDYSPDSNGYIPPLPPLAKGWR